MRKTLKSSDLGTVTRRDNSAAAWEDSIDRALARLLTSEDPAQRAIAARVILGDTYQSQRTGRLH